MLLTAFTVKITWVLDKESFLLFVIEENCTKLRYVLLAGNAAFRMKTSYT